MTGWLSSCPVSLQHARARFHPSGDIALTGAKHPNDSWYPRQGLYRLAASPEFDANLAHIRSR